MNWMIEHLNEDLEEYYESMSEEEEIEEEYNPEEELKIQNYNDLKGELK